MSGQGQLESMSMDGEENNSPHLRIQRPSREGDRSKISAARFLLHHRRIYRSWQLVDILEPARRIKKRSDDPLWRQKEEESAKCAPLVTDLEPMTNCIVVDAFPLPGATEESTGVVMSILMDSLLPPKIYYGMGGVAKGAGEFRADSE